jgi:multisubunit Na+/H+ antiporter MnhB subunit
MTEKSSLVPRIVGAVIAALLLIAIIEFVVPSLSQLFLNTTLTDQIKNGGTFISIGNYTAIYGQNPSATLWNYRGIDVMLQGLLFVVAAVGAATLFRLEKGKKEEKEG